MIYDKLINMGLYKGMNRNLDTAIDFILSHNLNELPMGKTVVDGDNVYKHHTYTFTYARTHTHTHTRALERRDTPNHTTSEVF